MSRALVLGGALSALMVLAALVSFVWTPFEHTAMNIPAKLQAPTQLTGSGRIISGATCFP